MQLPLAACAPHTTSAGMHMWRQRVMGPHPGGTRTLAVPRAHRHMRTQTHTHTLTHTRTHTHTHTHTHGHTPHSGCGQQRTCCGGEEGAADCKNDAQRKVTDL
jgi:hypothetical protein